MKDRELCEGQSYVKDRTMWRTELCEGQSYVKDRAI